ncbi:MAG: asparagine synthase (glutamine-hydrolyzing) [Betaproteobacteria bacterium RIFCSPLOWO2_12_FULL_66_14]|nr:MAG: asparagine synthase (glutamine-hydrolyzing) [Betaproteobacteria bacterium RIFCSPLOWO2_12_FULL_66_14]
MCGIAGHLRTQPTHSKDIDARTAAAMLQAIWHRGPDSGGQWRSPDALCWLGFRRLAIIDLATGDQPMPNEDRTVWTVFNGEIYNFKGLREQLIAAGHRFRSGADTEVLLHGYEQWGIEGLLQRISGIYAFALYDVKARKLFLARDRVGVKPLYWWADGNELLFGSEIKAMLPHPALRDRKVDPAAVAQFLVCRYVSRPRTMLEGVQSLPEGCYLESGVGDAAPRIKRYWDVSYAKREPEPSFGEALEELDALLMKTVEDQLVSDVPVGAQLSGGVDSSVVVAMMELSRRRRGDKGPIKTYSVGFDVPGFSELHYARMIADRYGTEHEEIRVGFQEFMSQLPQLCWLHDEPVGQPPAVPNYLMCRRAKDDVTVMLCGEGADEIFAGYNKYAFEQAAPLLAWVPDGSRKRLLKNAGALLPFKARRLRAIAEILALPSEAERYASWYGALDAGAQSELLTDEMRGWAGTAFLDTFREVLDQYDGEEPLSGFLYCDLHTRLVDDLLLKADRMSMAASVEARVPFLDHAVIEFAAGLPQRYKLRGARTKILLKKLAERYAPRELIYRRKVGFTVPLTRWMTGPMARFLRDTLLSDRCFGRGYWKPEALRRLVEGHLDRKVDREQGLWAVLALELWHRLYMDDQANESAVDRMLESFEEPVLAAAGS